MKRIISFIILFIYITGFVACSGGKADNQKEHDHETQEHEGHDHSSEGEEHNHEGHDHPHEGEDNDHEGHEHPHEGEDNDHEGHDHPHEGEDNDHEGHDHPHVGEDSDHEGHQHAEKEDSHEGHDHTDAEEEDSHEGHDQSGEDAHNHGNEIPAVKFSKIVDGIEIFVEYPALVKGENSKFIAHFTNLVNYKPISNAKAALSYNGKVISKANKVLRDGIFILEFNPSVKTKGSLKIALDFAGRTYHFNLKESRVFASKDDAIHAGIPHIEPDISFLKEQAWIGNFGVEEVKKKHFLSVVHTSGKIIPAIDNRITIVAQSNGIIDLPKGIISGKKLNKGERLASIKSDKMENSRTVTFKVAKAKFSDIESRYQIAAKLVKDNSISRKEFNQIEAEYKSTKAKLEVFGSFNNQGEFSQSNATSASGAMIIRSPRAAYIANLNVRNGDFVEQGSIIATLVVGDSYLLKVDFPKHEISKMGSIVDANFVPEYLDVSKLRDGALSVSELGGYPLYNSKTTAGDSPYIPFYFNLPDDPKLVPNSFATVSVKSQSEELANVIVLPVSAVLENEGSYWVYVEQDGENFTKREVIVGENNGKEIVITEGLKEGEIVVTYGASRVKQAALSLDIPEHTH